MKFPSWSLACGLCIAMASLAAAQNVPNPMPKPNLPAGAQPGAGQQVPLPQFGQPFNNGQGAANAAAVQQAYAQKFDLDGDGKLSAQEQLMSTCAATPSCSRSRPSRMCSVPT